MIVKVFKFSLYSIFDENVADFIFKDVVLFRCSDDCFHIKIKDSSDSSDSSGFTFLRFETSSYIFEVSDE